jgi:uncharacterized OsmC-like protein
VTLNLVYRARTYSSGTFGRAIGNVRGHNFIVDDGGWEEVGPGEFFLTGIAACGVNMMERLAKQDNIPLQWMDVTVECYRNPDYVPGEVSVYDAIRVHVEMWGVQPAHAQALVKEWKRLCPLYGSVAVATKDTTVTLTSHTQARDKHDAAAAPSAKPPSPADAGKAPAVAVA